MKSVRVTVLVENTASGRGILGEHGLSYWIEYGETRVLLDTGQTDVFARNARVLGIDLSRADAIVLSHGHYDHTGGLGKAMEIAPRAKVMLHPDALKAKFSRHADGSCHEVGMRASMEEEIRRRSGGLVFTPYRTEIAEGLFVTGRIPRANNFEDTGGEFFRDAACNEADPLNDDQAIYFRCAQGIVVLLGCAHAGVINTLEHIRALSDGWPIHAVVGGMHLCNATEARLVATLDALQSHEDMLIAPAHCTGARQKMLLWYRFPRRFRECNVGSQFVFE